MKRNYNDHIRVIEGFPKEGISFKDISPLLCDPKAFSDCIDDLAALAKDMNCDYVAGPESRGFVIGIPLAQKLGKGFIMARKKGKLPGKTIAKTYEVEYGTDTIEVPEFAVKKGERILLVDDLLATGGTLSALVDLFRQEGAEVAGIVTLIELTDLKGRECFDVPYRSLLKYPH